MKKSVPSLLLTACLFLHWITPVHAARPLVTRSMHYSGQQADILTYSYQPWMNTNVAITVEAWVDRDR